jgi:hypothetical protein
LAKVQKDLDAKCEEFHVPGAALVIVKDDKIVAIQGMGMRDVERKLPITPQTLFPIGSCTTSFVANLQVNNYDGLYNFAYGRFACTLDQSNGGAYYRMCTGVAGDTEGIHYLRQDPTRLMWIPVCDSSVQLQRALGQEVDFDGWPWPAVIRFLANAGGIIGFWDGQPLKRPCIVRSRLRCRSGDA